ncbi:hypothetical protein F5877DRAFT_72759 [Lentinula edodes]|nr:hypothetical protein F5877DRAFT_72759 [Lentinula edodes]
MRHTPPLYICGIDTARTRSPEYDPLPEDGLGNREFNTRHEDWDWVKIVRQLDAPLSLRTMKELYGMKIALKGLVYAPPDIVKDIPLDQRLLLWAIDDDDDSE